MKPDSTVAECSADSSKYLKVSSFGEETASAASDIIVDELLSYVGFYRNRSNLDAIRRTVLSFYSSSDISQAKRTLVGKFSTQLETSVFVVERRNSSTRTAFEAELDDISNIFDVLDLQGSFVNCKFVAFNLENLPKYGPEEN